jgi:hypothetical protein
VLGISSFWDQAIWGFLLLVAIALDQTITERLTSALRTRKPGARKPQARAAPGKAGPAEPDVASSPSSTGTRHA